MDTDLPSLKLWRASWEQLARMGTFAQKVMLSHGLFIRVHLCPSVVDGIVCHQVKTPTVLAENVRHKPVKKSQLDNLVTFGDT
jgi:hypothetical protein